ncbi:MAG: signal peptidase II [Synechococcaceae cyanobacterium]|nr:signal peptidase II [Synechococcaceae cyanobacterium]
MTVAGPAPRRPRPGLRPALLSWLLALLVVALDQGSKLLAVSRLPAGEVQGFLPGLLQLRRVSNSGAAFSLFTGSTAALGLVSLAVSLGVALLLLRRPPTLLLPALALGFLLGGALGNGIDRWRLGAVIDFLEFVPVSFPVFNIADVAINLAVLCFALDALAGLRREASRDA